MVKSKASSLVAFSCTNPEYKAMMTWIAEWTWTESQLLGLFCVLKVLKFFVISISLFLKFLGGGYEYKLA